MYTEHTYPGVSRAKTDNRVKTVVDEYRDAIFELTKQILPVTSTTGGKHSKGSLHYKALAEDVGLLNFLRTYTPCAANFPTDSGPIGLLYSTLIAMQDRMRNLGVIAVLKLESNHIHFQLTYENIIGGASGVNYSRVLLTTKTRKILKKAKFED